MSRRRAPFAPSTSRRDRESASSRLLARLSASAERWRRLRLGITTWSILVVIAAAVPVGGFLHLLYTGELENIRAEAVRAQGRDTEFVAEYVRWRLEALTAQNGYSVERYLLRSSPFKRSAGGAAATFTLTATSTKDDEQLITTIRLDELLGPAPKTAALRRAYLLDNAGRAYPFAGQGRSGDHLTEGSGPLLQGWSASTAQAGSGVTVKVIDGLSVAVVPDVAPWEAAEAALRRRFILGGASALCFGALLLLVCARRLRSQIQGVVFSSADGRGHSIISELDEVGEELASAREHIGRTVGELERARHDALTALPARDLFLERADALLRGVRGRNGFGVSVMYLDLDGFKALNDGKGHAYGDQVLRAAAMVLLDCSRETDVVGRLGGDEFVTCFAAPLESLPELATLAARRFSTAIAGLEDGLSCSIGWAYSRADSELPDLLQEADAAMYAAKREKKAALRATQHA